MVFTDYSFTFAKPGLETNLRHYASQKSNEEIMVFLFGLVRGYRNKIDYKIMEAIPTFNMSKEKEVKFELPDIWENLVREYTEFHRMAFLGTIHSHPDAISKRSKMDTAWALQLNDTYGNLILGIIGNRSTLRMYLVSDHRFILMQGNTKEFKIVLRNW